MASVFNRVTSAVAGLAAGIGTVAGVTYVATKSDAPPPFSLDNERFDQKTFDGRYRKMLTKCDPVSLLSPEDDVRTAGSFLKKFREKQAFGGPPMEQSDEELWDARHLHESAVHPDTNEIVPIFFRMSGYVPFNGPICVAMLVSKSTPTLLFWNWVNQSQNALVNYFNRNASSPTSTETLAVSYCGAVGSALAVVFGLSQLIQRRFTPETAKKLLQFVAFPASMVASSANCFIMRRPEIDAGISVHDEYGNVLADGVRSQIAAKQAVTDTVKSRVLLQIPCFLIPALVMSLPPIARMASTMPSAHLGLYTYVSISSFGLGLPAAIAAFPQTGEIKVSDLEEEFSCLKREHVYYNKGL